ncbi:ISL3 family transposase [Mangrovicoccus sp. HB161399]|uniref:ISL3 family transposase n=1 Tax=Mangrovicoccus sp. HB161399 TaxID=2720392 RepID=UPI001553737E|nr:ISL3 family transposase [Mangrovicoccus sp. HB161399]
MQRLSMKTLLPAGLVVGKVSAGAGLIEISARAAAATEACPCCGRRSRHVHSHYVRQLADLPAHGLEVRVLVVVRRFRCCAPRCPRAIFSERLRPEAARPWRRRTTRMQGLVRQLALALGGRPAQALGWRLLLRVSKDAFLRSLGTPEPDEMTELRAIGIDDWAWRKGQRYGTLICDLERHRVIDLLPDREPATVEAWLRNHPQIGIVARDRNGGYAGAVSRALPDAIQVADRWHLLENASEAFLLAVKRSMPAIRKAVGGRTVDPKMLTAVEKLQYEGFLRRQQTNRMVRQLADGGMPIRQIMRQTGRSRKLVRQVIRGEREDVFRIRESSLTPWLPRLEREWTGGCRNGAELWRRLRSAGFRGSLRVVGEWATRQRRAERAVPAGTGKSPPACKIARLLTSSRDRLNREDAFMFVRIEAALPALATARTLADRFADMVRYGAEAALAPWLDEAEDSMLGAFARSLRKDCDAVAAALSEPWSNGQTEGQINRLKMLKRQMYGRAGVATLKARITAMP